MLLSDVNVLVYAFRAGSDHHEDCRDLLMRCVNGDEAYGMASLVLSGFVRIVTHPRVFEVPDPIGAALAFANALRAPDHCVPVEPGARHWEIFERLCREANARGNLVPDAYLAALAIESGCEWITTDRDYARFPDLRWRQPSG
jgi:toxin-antitoxin system PIN domain toxin